MKVHSTAYGVPRETGRDSDDAFRVETREACVIAAIADGLGGARLGGAAARRAVAMITDYFLGRPPTWSPRRALTEFAARINRIFYQEAQLQHGAPELLCTLSVVVLEGGMLYGLNVGDSPVFVRRHGGLTRLSENHAYEEAGMEHVLTRAIGASATLEPYVFETPVDNGDAVVLCTDGVTTPLGPETLAALVTSATTARSLVSAARECAAGRPEWHDDASAIVLEIVDRGWRDHAIDRSVEVVTTLSSGLDLDGFRLRRPLESNERVWLAEEPDGTRAVLKFPAREALEDDARRDAFAREAWQAARLDAPGFPRAYVPADGTLRYYVMEFIEAPTLRELIAGQPLRVEETVALGQFLLHAGQALLRHDLAHGDIKPENILVLRRSDGATEFKLLDFGSAAEIFSVTSRAGTASYLAPERFREAPLSERTEIFAIGVTLYQSLTRAFPFGEVERFQTPSFEPPPRRISRINPAVPAWLDAIIARALSTEPERRYQTFSEMMFDLEHPEQVEPFYRRDAPLLERNPLLFYKVLCVILLILCGVLGARLLTR